MTDQPNAGKIALAVFWSGFMVFCASVITFVALSFRCRGLPEIDDSYSYIIKGAEVADPSRQAIEDLRRHLDVRAEDRKAALESHRQYHRIIFQYSPAHEHLLAAIHSLGLSWERSFAAAAIAGAALMCAAIAYFLYVAVGSGPAGIALIFLAGLAFVRRGFDYIAPYEFTWIIALFCWARIIARDGRAPISTIACSAAMLLMHPLGKLHSLITALIAATMNRSSVGVKRFLPSIAVCALIGLAVVADHIPGLDRTFLMPELRPDRAELRHYARETVETAWNALWLWLQTGGIALTAIPLVLGVAEARQRRLAVISVFTIYGIIQIASLLYPSYPYPALLFLRLWMPMAVMLAAFFGLFWWKQAVQLRHGRVVVAVVAVALLIHGAEVWRERMDKVNESSGVSMILDAQLPEKVVKDLAPDKRIIYGNEVDLYFFLTHGALGSGAVYGPSLPGCTPDDRRKWLDSCAIAVARSPLSTLANRKVGRMDMAEKIDLHRCSSVVISTESPCEAMSLSIENAGSHSCTLDISTPGTTRRFEIQPKWSGAIFFQSPASRQFTIAFEDARNLFLTGVSFGEQQESWPWRERATVQIERKSNYSATTAERISFDPRLLVPPKLADRGLAVIDDRSSSVVMRIEPGKVVPP